MGVGVRIVSKNLNPKAGTFGEGKPQWRQDTMTESLSAGRLSEGSPAASSVTVSDRRRRRNSRGGRDKVVGLGRRGSRGSHRS